MLILRDGPHRRVHNQRPEDHLAHRPVATLIGKTARRSLLYSTVITFAAIVFAAITLAAIAFAAITLAALSICVVVVVLRVLEWRVNMRCVCTRAVPAPCGVVSAACVCRLPSLHENLVQFGAYLLLV